MKKYPGLISENDEAIIIDYALEQKLLKRKKELIDKSDSQSTLRIATALENDVDRLNVIFKKQSTQIKTYYEDTANVFKKVEAELKKKLKKKVKRYNEKLSR